MSFNVKIVLRRIGIFSLTLSMCVTSVGITSLTYYSENQGIIIEDDVLLGNQVKVDNFLISDDKVRFVEENEIELLDEFDDTFNLDIGIASFSNVFRTTVAVTTADELEEAIALAEDGAVIEIANDIFLTKTIILTRTIILQTSKTADNISIYSPNERRHFIVEGDVIHLTFQNVVLDGNEQSGGIESNANNFILSNANIINCMAPSTNTRSFGGAIYALGELNITNSEFTNNAATMGGCIYGKSNVKIFHSNFIKNHSAKSIYGGDDIGGVVFLDVGYHNGTVIYNKLSISNCQFMFNSSLQGGVIFMGEGELYIINSKFIDNFAESRGAAIYHGGGPVYIYGCEFTRNNANYYAGAIAASFSQDKDVMLIKNTKMHNNKGGQRGGAIAASPIIYDNYDGSMDNKLIISNCEITENASQLGGAIHANLNVLKVINGSVIKNNFAPQAYEMLDKDDIEVHNQQIDSTTTWTEGFDYIYNNLDIGYTKGIPLEVYEVEIFEFFEDGEKSNYNKLQVAEGKPLYYPISIPIGYEAIIKGISDQFINSNRINIPSVIGNYNIKITYIPILEENTHTVTLITQYLDGIQPDESVSYQVRSGESFEETYNALEGYEFAGISLRSAYPLVDGDTQTVYIDSVTDDCTITIKLSRKSQTIKITTQYLDGILPDETKSYLVFYGDNFAESYEALEGYTFVGMSVRSYPYVDWDLQMVYIDEVKEDYHIIIKLDKAEYNVTIIVQYPEGTIDNQVFTYSVLYGDSFEEFFNVESGYRIAAIQTEKGVDVDFQKQIVEIESVKKDMIVTIICR